jgi:hypothetical protein
MQTGARLIALAQAISAATALIATFAYLVNGYWAMVVMALITCALNGIAAHCTNKGVLENNEQLLLVNVIMLASFPVFRPASTHCV